LFDKNRKRIGEKSNQINGVYQIFIFIKQKNKKP